MLTQKEVLNLPELLNAHAAMIERAAVEQEMCQDAQLRQILERHAQVCRRHHGMLQWMLDRAQGQAAGDHPAGHYRADVPGNGTYTQGFQGFEPYRPGAGAGGGRRIGDRALAIGCLEMNKHLALTATWMALESAHPDVRRALMDVARDHVEMAFELFNFLQQRQWYATPAAPRELVQQVAQGFPGGHAGAPAGAPAGALAAQPAGGWAGGPRS